MIDRTIGLNTVRKIISMNSNITIESLRARTVLVPMSEPHRTASGVISECPLVLVDITTNTGVVGHSVVFTFTPAALNPTAQLIKNLEPIIANDLLAPIDLEQMLVKRFRLLGTQGLIGMALAGIDMALWDALARVQKTSLVSLLGGAPKPVRAYAAIGYDGVRGCAETAEKWAKIGFKGIKAKIGYPTVQEDLAVIQAMRKAAGDEMAIMVDYNQSLSPIEAIERIRILDDEGLFWVEEPTIAHDYSGHARVAKATKTPIQCGENWWGTLDMQHAIDANSIDFAMIDAMKIGGVTGWIRAAAIAHANGLPLSSHLWPEVSAQLLCCSPTAHWLEYADWWNPILAQPLRIENGFAMVDDGIGSGISWNEEAINRFLQ